MRCFQGQPVQTALPIFSRGSLNSRACRNRNMERDFIAKNRPTSLIRRLASVEEVANMVVFVCSPQASATTGAALRVDGGVVRSIA